MPIRSPIDAYLDSLGSLDDNLVETERQEALAAQPEQAPAEENGIGFGETILDVLGAVPRGAGSLAQGVWDFADFLFADALPDIDKPLLGTARTDAGKLTQGFSEFALGFIPVVGWIGRGAKIGRFALTPGLSRQAQALTLLDQKALKAAGIAGARGATAGALVDFALLDGHEQRLSNLLSDTSFENPLTEFLAADPDDSQAVGKLKGVLEGMLLGALGDGVIESLSSLRAARRLREAGASVNEVVKPIEEAGEKIRVSAKKSNDEIQQLADDATDKAMDQTVFKQTGERTEDGEMIFRGSIGEQQFDLVHRPIEEGSAIKGWFLKEQDPDLAFKGSDGSLGSRRIDAEMRIEEELAKSAGRRAIDAAPDDLAAKPLPLTTDELPVEGGPAPEAFSEPWVRETIGEFLAQRGVPSATNPRNATIDELREWYLSNKDHNLLHMAEDEAQIVRVVARLFRGLETDDARRVISNPEVVEAAHRRTADLVGGDSQPLESLLAGHEKTSYDILVDTVAAEMVVTQYARDFQGTLGRVVTEIEGGSLTAGTLGEFLHGMNRIGRLQARIRGVTAMQGRALQTGNIDWLGFSELQNLVVENGGRNSKNLLLLAKRMQQTVGKATPDEVAGLNKMVAGLHGNKTLEVISEFWINSILSGGKTLSVNALSGFLLTMYRPMELMVGSLMTRNSREFRIAASRYWGMSRGFRESLKAAKEAAFTETGVLTPDLKVNETASAVRKQGPAISAEALNIDPELSPTLAKMVNYAGKILRYPSAALVGTDEFFKQLNYRGVAWAKFLDKALEDSPHSLAQAADIATSRMDDVFVQGQAISQEALYKKFLAKAREPGTTHNGAALDTPAAQRAYAIEQSEVQFNQNDSLLGHSLAQLSREALDEAQGITFTKPLGSGDETVGFLEAGTADFQGFVQRHPLLRFFTPFIRTPFRIVQHATERTIDPLWGGAMSIVQSVQGKELRGLRTSQSRFARDLAAGGARKADAMGRLATGVGAFITFTQLAMDGSITGRGPSDREQRRLLEAAGWLPYSFKVGDSYIQYQRLDPFATLIGIMADTVTIGKYSPEEDQPVLERLGNSIMIALTQNLTQKTYMTGLRNLVEALDDPERAIPRLMQRYAGSMVHGAFVGPVTGGGILLGSEPVDPTMREVRSVADAVLNKLPYQGDNLDPVRNFLGEPVRKMESLGADQVGQIANMFVPIMYSSTTDKLVEKEVASLQHAFQPPLTSIGSIDLREFRRESGQSAYDRMLELRKDVRIGGNDLRRSLRELIRSREYQSLPAESTFEVRSPRIELINAVINRFHNRAVERMRQEFPELERAIQLQRSNQAAARRGGI